MKKITLIYFLLTTGFFFGQNFDFTIGGVSEKNYYQEIDFSFVKNKIIIPVKIDNKIFRFILDTGAPTIISEEVFRELQPELLNTVPVKDANEVSDSLRLILLEQIFLGDLTFKKVPALVHDFNSNPIFKCFEVDGFVGSNMLAESIVHIDLEKKKLILTDVRKKLDLSNLSPIKMELVGNQKKPFITINLSGEKLAKDKVLIDTGMDGFYDPSNKLYQHLKGKEVFNILNESEGSSVVGILGDAVAVKQALMHFPSLEFAGVGFRNFVGSSTNDKSSRIGAELLNYGAITMDFKNKKFYLKAKESIFDLKEKLTGFSPTMVGDQLIVGFVWDEKLGKKISYGDKIIKMNERLFDSSNLCESILSIASDDTEDEITLQIERKDGSISIVQIQKRFPKELFPGKRI